MLRRKTPFAQVQRKIIFYAQISSTLEVEPVLRDTLHLKRQAVNAEILDILDGQHTTYSVFSKTILRHRHFEKLCSLWDIGH